MTINERRIEVLEAMRLDITNLIQDLKRERDVGEPVSSRRARRQSSLTVRAKILQVLPEMGEPFTAQDIERAISQKWPKYYRDASSYTACLTDFVKAGVLNVVERGSGRRPTIFGKRV